ncbi:asparagine synthase (glutamine-hydrolyzing) [Mucilaginibacter lacusdianchii]|uniref:asparagine synthase (glutamine-hydrolyzing) n=1 Tax=Mucilaginibacter lacusdianchii TaxID=2684211 RepID=UPI00131DFDB1|nr:asparagine synthase (glutamine-hydrolyzing) [Mucilaginibacter sp. JXJ CY 39]
MCGIAGLYHFDRQRSVDAARLQNMSSVIHHRGPDGEGFYINGNVGLAHRRLSIIDLASGQQPMYNDDKEIALVFNGEIYNYLEVQQELIALGHRFHTSSDTEVIIRGYEEWGTKCQEKFNGMWSFALWDNRQQLLFISRDRMGEKPLYYGVINNTLVFGSEIKSFKGNGLSLQPDTDMLELYLFLGYIPEPHTFYKNIKKLRAGHYLLVSGQNVQELKYWDLPDINENHLLSNAGEVTEEFSHLFTSSVDLRMRSDVAFGAFLSGGLDSSSIVSVMSGISKKPVETFTIGFNEKKFDERDKARLVADRFKTNHHEHVIEVDTLEDALKKILFHYDEPFADPAAIPTGIISKYAGQNVKMVLTGDGADEVLAGYSSYQSEKMAGGYNSLPGVIRKSLPFLLQQFSPLFAGNLRYKINQGVRVLNAYNMPFQNRLISKSVKIAPSGMKALLCDKHLPIEDFVQNAMKDCPFTDPFYQLMYYHLKVSLPGQMLVKVDRMSMAYSIETRAPFLDHRIVEHMYKVDKKVKVPDMKSVKQVLKSAMKNKLPDEIINRKKKGFDVPLREWFKDDSLGKTLDVDFGQYGLNQQYIKTLISENNAGKADHGTLIWRLLVYSNWMKQF